MIPGKKILQTGYIAVVSVLLILLASAAYKLCKPAAADKLSKPQNELPVSVTITCADLEEVIRPWYDENGKWYFFLPTYANRGNTAFSVEKGNCYLQNNLLTSGQSLDYIEFEKEYSFEERNPTEGINTTIVFLKSANIPSMHLTTLTGGMDYVNRDQDHKEKVNIHLYNLDGTIDYAGTWNDIIKGRGNSTWELDKKPYNIKLAAKAEFLGMSSARNWVLLANAIDKTNLRNKLVFDFSKEIEYCWTPDSQFVDLYINGEYQGLYLLAEKVEVDNHRLDIDPAKGILISQMYKERMNRYTNAFTLKSKRVFCVKYPKAVSARRQDAIENKLQLTEDAIKNGTWQSYIDKESWLKKALIEEVFANGDIASLYYYWEDSDSPIYAGPVWDYDNAMGNTFWVYCHVLNPTSFSIGSVPKIESDGKSFACLLYQDDSFQQAFAALYNEHYPLLYDLFHDRIWEYAGQIQKSAEMNSVRWEKMFAGQPAHTEISDIAAFMDKRLTFLKGMLVDHLQYCAVSFQNNSGGAYRTFLIEQGKPFGEIPAAELFPVPSDAVWYDAATNEEFDPSKPVMSDISLYAVTEHQKKSSGTPAVSNTPDSRKSPLEWLMAHKNLSLLIVLCAMISSVGAVLVYLDMKHNGTGGADGAA